jgi:DegV family protein with EDD domain
MRKTAVVTDSVATLPGELAEQMEIEIVPLQISFGLEAYRDGVDMTAAQFYARLATSRELPTTAAPRIGDIIAVYEQAAQKAEAVVAIHVSANLSTTIHSALQAAAETKARVTVVDSRTGAIAEGLIALEAARAALAGAGPEEVLAKAREMMERVRLLVMLDTLKYLQRGGRIGKAQAWPGEALQFKPIVTLGGGVVEPVAKPVTRQRGEARMVHEMAGDVHGRPVHAAITHAAAPAEAEKLQAQLTAQFACRELLITEFTPVMGAHAGPGVVGIAWWAEEGGG